VGLWFENRPTIFWLIVLLRHDRHFILTGSANTPMFASRPTELVFPGLANVPHLGKTNKWEFEMNMKSENRYQHSASRVSLLIILAASLCSLNVATTSFADTVSRSDNAVILAQSKSPPQNENRPGPPPKEALSACQGKSENTSCSFTDTRRGAEIDGTCRKVPEGQTACVPNDGPPPPKAG
jgi:hypothetical protein